MITFLTHTGYKAQLLKLLSSLVLVLPDFAHFIVAEAPPLKPTETIYGRDLVKKYEKQQSIWTFSFVRNLVKNARR